MSAVPIRPLRIIPLAPVVVDAEERVYGRLERTAHALGLEVPELDRLRGASTKTPIAERLSLLYVWSRYGWGDERTAGEALIFVKDALAALHYGDQSRFADLEDDYEHDPPTDLDRVLLAAWSRLKIAQNNPITARELAVLAGMTTQAVRALIRSGEIEVQDVKARPAKIYPSTALAWLTSKEALEPVPANVVGR